MAESGKSKWFHKLEPKPSSKHQNGIIGPVEHIRLFRDFSFSNIQKFKIAEKSYMLNWTYVSILMFELGLGSSLWIPDLAIR
jgi:hypothetical protein